MNRSTRIDPHRISCSISRSISARGACYALSSFRLYPCFFAAVEESAVLPAHAAGCDEAVDHRVAASEGDEVAAGRQEEG